MPHKFNPERRHHIPKMPFEVTHWFEYEAGRRRHASLTMWMTGEPIDARKAAQRSTPGGQAGYSDGAMQIFLMLRAAFKRRLRQAEVLPGSFIELLGCELPLHDRATASQRAIKLPSIARAALPEDLLRIAIDSAGLKVCCASKWLADKHGQRARCGRQGEAGSANGRGVRQKRSVRSATASNAPSSERDRA